MIKFKSILLLAVSLLAFASCSSDDEGDSPKTITKSQLSGKVEKGPFVQGSEVIVYELASNFAQTGKSFRSQTENHFGQFQLNTAMELQSPYVDLAVQGYYFNEVKGTVSTGQITLRAIADISNKSSVNVNLLTHLERGRVLKLIQDGKSFADAKKQADKELLAVFAITNQMSNPEDISIADNNDNAGILLAISTILLAEHSDGEFSELIAQFSTDFAQNGNITNANIRNAIKEGQGKAHPKTVIENMSKFYEERNLAIQIQDFSKFIDYNGDGIIDSSDEEGLNEEPQESIIEESFFNNENDVIMALNGCYSYTRDFSVYLATIESILLADADNTAAKSENLYNDGSSYLSKAWENAYRAINMTNVLIAGLESVTSDYDGRKIGYIAEARSLRAFVYYHISTLWGRVPFTLSYGADERPPIKEYKDILPWCVDELEQVKSHLNNYDDQLHVSTNAIEALLINCELSYKRSSLFSVSGQKGWTLSLVNADGSYPALYNSLVKPYIKDGIIVFDDNTYALLNSESKKTESLDEIVAKWLALDNSYIGKWEVVKRTGYANEKMGIDKDKYYLPIPSREKSFNSDLTDYKPSN